MPYTLQSSVSRIIGLAHFDERIPHQCAKLYIG